MSPERLSARGVFVLPWGVPVPRGDGFYNTAESARIAGVKPATIRKWRQRGWLATQGLDEQGRPLHTREAITAAERRVTENGIRASGISPRQLRRRQEARAA